MPSQAYADNHPSAPLTQKLQKSRADFDSKTGKATERFGPTRRHLSLSDKGREGSQKEAQNKLARLQNSAPKLAENLKKGKKRAVAQLAFRMFSQVDLMTDWLFILLGSFAFLKDLFDIVFAAAGAGSAWLNGVPVVGTIANVSMIAIGMTFTFVGNLMFLILTVTVLVLAGSSFKNRGFAKYIIGIAMEFIAEALPGISWLPWTVIYVFILYLCVLYDRAFVSEEQSRQTSAEQESEESEETRNIPASGTATDGYQNRLAA
jgi:hypothetical protein